MTAALALLALSSCDDTGSDPGPIDPPQVAGSWAGTFRAGQESLPAQFTLTQQGFVVGGTAQIDGLLPRSEIEAAIDQASRVVMLVENGCESWFGTLNVSTDENRLDGTFQVDRSACPTGVDSAGTLSLTRQ